MSEHHDDVLSSLSAGRTPEGLPTTSRGGPDVSVRPTIPADADTLGEIHAATMRAALAAGADLAADDPSLPGIEPGDLALAWASAADVSQRGHHVLTALDAAEVVGLAAIAPAAPATPEEDELVAEVAGQAAGGGQQQEVEDDLAGTVLAAGRGTLVEIIALEVAPGHERVGHGSRLLAACADLARDSGATALSIWVMRGDEPRQRFLDAAGFSPSGRRREIPVAEKQAIQDEWWANLGSGG